MCVRSEEKNLGSYVRDCIDSLLSIVRTITTTNSYYLDYPPKTIKKDGWRPENESAVREMDT